VEKKHDRKRENGLGSRKDRIHTWRGVGTFTCKEKEGLFLEDFDRNNNPLEGHKLGTPHFRREVSTGKRGKSSGGDSIKDLKI